ncbi:MAG: hypothetical protein LUH00_03595 [Lachnospiraceae bacterium]|nr:hypothetical protein [Lachnospiraceae bacterium]
MEEYSRIVIEEYCMTHRSKRRDYIWYLLGLSYSLEALPTDEDALFLEKAIKNEKTSELKEALQDLDDYLFF